MRAAAEIYREVDQRQEPSACPTVDELILAFRGRIANTAGDSVLAEFASVVDAVRCAVLMQHVVAELNETLAEERRMWFRIGINVGDIMAKDGDIFGDGVNIAARLQTLAEPGGICVSRGVRDQIRHLGAFQFEDLGEQRVKNIERPIRAFRVIAEADAMPEPAERDPEPAAAQQPTGLDAGTALALLHGAPGPIALCDAAGRLQWCNPALLELCGRSNPKPHGRPLASLLGLVLVVPLLGHASWHAYRDLVDASSLPERLAPGETA